ncbi:MAG: copper-translocating P-type ATPase [Firmicutes bacterium]|nr:copper-translocating P-type ATPase [Bacillota bacterium]
MKKVTWQITGMSCAACSARIEKVLNRTAGIDQATVNLTAAKAYITYDPKQIDEDAICRRIEQLGFGVQRQQKDLEAVYRFSDFVAAAILTLLLMYVAMGHMLSLPLPEAVSRHHAPLAYALLQLVLTVPVLIIGRRFYVKGWPLLLKGSPNMDSLIAMGTSAAVVYSLYSLILIARGDATYVEQLYFDSAAMIITLVLLGKTLEERAKGRADTAVRQLLDLAPRQAQVIREGQELTLDVSQVLVGDTVLIRPGASLPVDGQVIQGSGSINEAYLTGEPIPREVGVGDEVTGGTINTNGSFSYRVTRVGSDTKLAQIARLMEEAQAGKAPIARLADKVAGVFVPVVLGIALVAAVCWLLGGQTVPFALRVFIAVLVIACPCALGLATPTALTVAMGKAAQLGILVKSGAILEQAGHIDQVVFDKTGTVTKGRPEVVNVLELGLERHEALNYACSLEHFSEHPLAQAVLRAGEAEGVELLPVDGLSTLTGLGVCGAIQGRRVLLGNDTLLLEQGCDLTAALPLVQEEYGHGCTVVYLAVDGVTAACFALADGLRTESREAISELRQNGRRTVLLTGDNQRAAAAIGAQAGVDDVIANVLPDGKLNVIKELQSGSKVMMVGDGVNDAPALQQADIGVAMGGGADVATEAADVVFLHDDLRLTYTLLRLSRATIRNIKQNLTWAFCYNIIGIPIAAGVLYLFGGPLLHPAVGAVAMSLSSFSVVSNALRLKRFK